MQYATGQKLPFLWEMNNVFGCLHSPVAKSGYQTVKRKMTSIKYNIIENDTSFKQIIIMGQITGTLMLDNTLKALALISWFESCKSK